MRCVDVAVGARFIADHVLHLVSNFNLSGIMSSDFNARLQACGLAGSDDDDDSDDEHAQPDDLSPPSDDSDEEYTEEPKKTQTVRRHQHLR